MWILGNEAIDLVLLRHSNWDTTSETSVLLGVSLVYIPSIRTFGALFPPSLWPVPFTNPQNLLFRVATWIPVCLLMSLWLSFPSWYISQAVIISSSVHFWSCWSLCAELRFHLILWTSFLFFAGCLGVCFLPFFSLTMVLECKKRNFSRCLAWCLSWLVGVCMSHSKRLQVPTTILYTQEWECKVCVLFWHRNNTCLMVPSVTTTAINPFNSIRVFEYFYPLRNIVQTRLQCLLQVLYIFHSPISSPILCSLHPFLNKTGNLFKWDMPLFRHRSRPSETPENWIAFF